MSFFKSLRYIQKTQILMVQQYQDMVNQVYHLSYDFLLILFDRLHCHLAYLCPDVAGTVDDIFVTRELIDTNRAARMDFACRARATKSSRSGGHG